MGALELFISLYASSHVNIFLEVVAFKKAVVWVWRRSCLSTLSTDTPGQLDVLGHDSHPLGMDGTKVGVFEETHEVSLAGLLKSSNSGALEAQVSLEVLGDLPDQTLEWQLPDEKFSGFLVTPDLPESNSSWPVTVRLLHSSGGWCALPGCLGGQLFPWSFSSSWFSGGLLRTSHLFLFLRVRYRMIRRVRTNTLYSYLRAISASVWLAIIACVWLVNTIDPLNFYAQLIISYRISFKILYIPFTVTGYYTTYKWTEWWVCRCMVQNL